MPGTEPEFLPPGLYLIQPATITVFETLYVTAPKITGERLTLEGKKSGYERQIWRVKAVHEDGGYRTIERGDWSHTEYPPTFGLKPPSEDRKPVYCLDGEAENPHKWMIRVYNVGSGLFRQPNFAIIPFQAQEYFVNDDGPGGSKGPKPDVTLARLDNLIVHTWYFEEIRPPVNEVVETEGESEVVEAKGESEVVEAKEGEGH